MKFRCIVIILFAMLFVGCGRSDDVPLYRSGCVPGWQNVPCTVSVKLQEPDDTDVEVDSTPLDAEFFATHTEPDGTNPALIEYAAEYCQLWQDEAARVYTERYGDSSSDMLAELAEAIERELDEYRQQFAAGDGKYGREAEFMVTWQRALAYRKAAIDVNE